MMEGVLRLCAFINMREKHRNAKELGHRPRVGEKDYDDIISAYRFCNVRRNDDRVTQWIHRNWMMPLKDDPDVWFAVVLSRLLNFPDSLAAVAPHVLPYRPEQLRRVLHKRAERGLRNFNAAYIVSTNGRAMDKVDYVIDIVLKPLWAGRTRLRPSAGDTLDTYHLTLCQNQGLGSFMAAQAVADLKYIDPLAKASDWLWWAASGPGSRRGLNRVMGKPVDSAWTEERWRQDFHDVWNSVNGKLNWSAPLTGQDVQNCLCEFDKYERARNGEGRPKQFYRPYEEK